MNDAFYFRNFIDDKFLERLKKIWKQDEFIYSVLTVHLAAEKIINGWLCYKTQSDRVLDNMDKLSFSHKLKLAQNLDLPRHVHGFILSLNKIRNKFAHDLEQDEISDKELNDLENNIKPLLKFQNQPPLDEIYVYGESKTDRKRYISCSKNIKLSFLFLTVYFYMSLYFVELKKNDGKLK